MRLREPVDHTNYFDDIGRVVVNALGQPEILVMKHIYWRYLDWLYDDGADIEEFIARCDLTRGDQAFANALSWWTFQEFERRERLGLPRPGWLLPLDPLSDAP